MKGIASDCHVHSIFSHDGRDSMDKLAQAAYEAGLGYLCISDHCDDCVFGDFDASSMETLIAQLGHPFNPYAQQTGLYDSFLAARERAKGKVELLLGVEISGMHHDPEKGRELMALYPFDYVLGSIHNLRNCNDFYGFDYGDGSGFHQLAADYIDESIEMVKLGGFDALAHFGYFLRYMARRGITVADGFMPYIEHVSRLFTLMRDKGIALEVNTSGLNYGYPELIPSRQLLGLYKSLGGELVTLGSDSHRAEGVGGGLLEARQMLASLGFKYYTVYRDRKPMMLPLI